jgi:hypothetical protein
MVLARSGGGVVLLGAACNRRGSSAQRQQQQAQLSVFVLGLPVASSGMHEVCSYCG